MKKLFVTLACLAVLALYGAYAYNQNMFKANSEGNTADLVVTKTPYQSGQLATNDVSPTPLANSISTPIPTDKAIVSTTPSGSKVPSTISTTPSVISSAQTTKAPSKSVATPKPSANTNISSSTGLSSFATEVLRLVNQQRAKSGLVACTTNQTLSSASGKRAQEISITFSHTRPNGSSFSSVLKEYGISYRAAGENIASGQKTPQEVVNAWMNSPGHRANILNTKYRKLGVGVYQKSGSIYWTQVFTN